MEGYQHPLHIEEFVYLDDYSDQETSAPVLTLHPVYSLVLWTL